jgi:membrane protein DedA with SNARE-associated domain
VVVFGGALAAREGGGFAYALIAGTFGSTLGFMTMYGIGKWFGRQIIEKGRIRFFPIENVHKLETWFATYGYWIIVGNRFMAGTRAIVSFFAGLSNLNLIRTTLLSFISSLAWYSILVYAGYSLGQHWEKIGFYLSTYSELVTGAIILIAIVLAARYFIKKNNTKINNG